MKHVLLAASLILAACSGSTSADLGEPPTRPVSDEVPDVAEGGLTTISTELSDGTLLSYSIVVPEGFDASQEYPVFLAMPPGPQDVLTTANVTDGWYRGEAVRRGWVVVSPAAPNETLWFQGSEQYIEEFLDDTLAWLRPEGGRFHIGGVSNGGRATFRVLSLLPNHFASVVVYPGHAVDQDEPGLTDSGDIPFTIWVGENDTPWIAPSEQTRDDLEALGKRVTFKIWDGEPHVIRELTDGVEIFDVLEAARP